jgi:hypothetical protein
MKAKIGDLEVDGTPDEIAKLVNALEQGPLSAWRSLAGRNLLKPKEASSGPFVSQEIAFRVIKRRPLSQEQSKMLSILRKAGDEWVSAKALQASLGYSSSQLAGMLGAFGKRLSGTDGYIEGTWFFDQDWDYASSCYQYRLPDSVRSAVVKAGV